MKTLIAVLLMDEEEKKSIEEETGDKVMERFFELTDNLSGTRLSATAKYLIGQLNDVLKTWPDESDSSDGQVPRDNSDSDYPQHWSQERGER